MERDKHPFEFAVGRSRSDAEDRLRRNPDATERQSHHHIEEPSDLRLTGETMRSHGLATCLVMTILAGVYVVAGKLGLLLALVHASATVVWLPTGITLAAFLVLGYRVWPGIFLGAFLVNISTEGSLATSFGIAIGNTLEGVVGAYLVNRFAHGRRAFYQAKDVLTFAMLAGLMSTTVSATVGVTSLALGGYADWVNYRAIWLTWWLGDVAGALIVAPFLILWSLNRRLQWSRAQLAEAALLCTTLILVTLAVFGGFSPSPVNTYSLEYLCLPCLVWAAYRYGPRETATATIILAGFAIFGTLRGGGPFAVATLHESLLLLQAFLGFTCVLALTFAAVVSKKRRIERSRERLLKELQDALTHMKTLRGLIPICSSCKKIRNDGGYWDHVESFIEEHSLAQFTHGVCPDCVMRMYSLYQSTK